MSRLPHFTPFKLGLLLGIAACSGLLCRKFLPRTQIEHTAPASQQTVPEAKASAEEHPTEAPAPADLEAELERLISGKKDHFNDSRILNWARRVAAQSPQAMQALVEYALRKNSTDWVLASLLQGWAEHDGRPFCSGCLMELRLVSLKQCLSSTRGPGSPYVDLYMPWLTKRNSFSGLGT